MLTHGAHSGWWINQRVSLALYLISYLVRTLLYRILGLLSHPLFFFISLLSLGVSLYRHLSNISVISL